MSDHPMSDPPIPWPAPTGTEVDPQTDEGLGTWDDTEVAWDDDRYDFEGNPLAYPWEFNYRSGDGTQEVVLDVMVGVRGRFMPTVQLLQDIVPFQPGWRYRGARHTNRLIILPTVLTGIYERRSDRIRNVARALDPMRGIGTLGTFSRSHGFREIDAVYSGGLDAADEVVPWGIIAPLQFDCPDPYWQDRLEQRAQAQIDPAGTWISINNTGDAECWPTWNFTGGGGGLIMWQAWAGEANAHLAVLSFNGDVDGLVIDTRPERKTVTRHGANVFYQLAPLSRLAPFPPGESVWIVQTPEPASLLVTWTRHFLVP